MSGERQLGEGQLFEIQALLDGGCDPELAVPLIQSLRKRSKDYSIELDRNLLQHLTRLRLGLMAAKENFAKAKTFLEELKASPWCVGVYLGKVQGPKGQLALVGLNGGRRVVPLDEGLDVSSLRVGEEVIL